MDCQGPTFATAPKILYLTENRTRHRRTLTKLHPASSGTEEEQETVEDPPPPLTPPSLLLLSGYEERHREEPPPPHNPTLFYKSYLSFTLDMLHQKYYWLKNKPKHCF